MLSDEKKGDPPWMTPEEGDEVGQKIAADAATKAAEVAGEAPAEASGAKTEASEGEAAVEFEGPDEGATVDLSQTVIDLEEELQKTKDRLLRSAADYENFRKRSQREQEESRVRGREEILRELIGVYDNLERALDSARAHAEQAPVAMALIDGVAMVQRQFLDGLGKFGLKQFSALGTPFDPTFHEAMAQQKSDRYPPGTVMQEYLKGYMLGERLLRAAMVIVAGPDSTGVAEQPAEPAPASGDGAQTPSGDTKDREGSEEGSA